MASGKIKNLKTGKFDIYNSFRNNFIKNDSKIPKKDWEYLMLDGGKCAFFSQEERDSFLRFYSRSYSKKGFSLCEISTSISKLYLDLDFMCSPLETYENFMENTLKKTMLVIQEILLNYYDDEDLTYIVCTEGRIKPVEGKGKKVGVHVIYPDLPLSKKTMRSLCALFTEALNEKIPRDVGKGENPWNTVLDPSVYRDNMASLRILGSRKYSKKEGVEVYSKFYYDAVYASDGRNLKVPFEEKLKWCSIRVSDNPEDEIISNADILPPNGVYQPPDRKFEESVELLPQESKPIVETFMEIIRKDQKFNKMWGNLTIRKVCKQNDGKVFINVEGEGKRTCANKGGDHSSCNIYFLYFSDTQKFAQKCFCKCDKVRGGVRCKDFTLFLNEDNTNTCKKSKKKIPVEEEEGTQKKFTLKDLLKLVPIKNNSILRLKNLTNNDFKSRNDRLTAMRSIDLKEEDTARNFFEENVETYAYRLGAPVPTFKNGKINTSYAYKNTMFDAMYFFALSKVNGLAGNQPKTHSYEDTNFMSAFARMEDKVERMKQLKKSNES